MTTRTILSRLTFVASCGLAALLTGTVEAHATTIDVTVLATSGPWVDSVNPANQYGSGDEGAPTEVTAADGFDFTAGGTFTIDYVSGLTNPFGGAPAYDGIGETDFVANDFAGSSGNLFPSASIDPLSYPAYLNALVGTFADASGAIVGVPFLVGNDASVLAPSGAAKLLLGFNDDIFNDNIGALTVSVTGPDAVNPVPEPATMALLGSGIVGVLVRRRRA